MVKKLFVSIVLLAAGFIPELKAQNPGDTVVVQTLNYSSTTRDTVIQFPNDPNVSYEKIIMKYNMRCKDAKVSTGTNRNLGCGEWDYSCNTYITDSAHVDSLTATHPQYIISGFSGSVFNYVSTPTNTYTRYIQKEAAINSVTNEDSVTIGNGNSPIQNVFQTAHPAGKTLVMLKASELSAAGLSNGSIDAMTLDVAQLPQLAKQMRVRMKAVADTFLDAGDPDLTGFTEVFFHDFNFALGENRIQFYTPFAWNGTSNVIVELTFYNKTGQFNMSLNSDTIAEPVTLATRGDHNLSLDGNTYIEADTYQGFAGSQPRTIEAWVKTTGTGEIVGWGTNASSQKCLFRIEGQGRLRYEVNGGNVIGTTSVNDGNWHHVAVVQSGGNLQSVTFYVDGQADGKSALNNANVNTQLGINFRVTNAFHGNRVTGEIEDVRLWDAALSGSTIAKYMTAEVDANHPDAANLQLYYKFNEGTGSTIADLSGNNRNATVVGNQIWNQLNGLDHFKNFETSGYRPNIELFQGNYNLTVQNDTVIDTLQNHSFLVDEYQVYSKAGTVYSDSLGVVMSGNFWEATAEEMFDESGNLITTFPISADGTYTLQDLTYWQRSPSAFEIMSFVTPYGIGLDLGVDGETWTFDVTDFAPILKGNQRMYMSRGGQWQEEMDIEFWFIVGTPPREVLDIQQIWRVDARNYQDLMSDKYYEPRDVMMNPNGDMFKVRTAISGHGQEGEFIPRTHYINIDGGAPELSWQAWKECAYNPIYPQGGTWIYDRAGWCPGMATDVQELDITSLATAGQTTEIDYGVTSASGTSRYIINSQLVSYGQANFTNDAAVVDIISPSSKIEYARMQDFCSGPKIVIKNTGSALLTSATINYWLNGASTPETFAWTGTLGAFESEEITLPVGQIWDNIAASGNVFYAEVVSPNGQTDEYPLNSKMYTPFEVPEVVPNELVIWFKSNNSGFENSYEIFDEAGNLVFNRSGFGPNQHNIDTVSLANGCYQLKFYDSDDDGISFWANNDGSGYLRLRDANTNAIVKNFEPDFGGGINYQFTVNFPLSYEEIQPKIVTTVYPNPAQDRINVLVENPDETEVALFSQNGQLLELPKTKVGNNIVFDSSKLSAGVYFVKVSVKGNVEVKKVVIL